MRAQGSGIRVSRKSAAKDEGNLVEITDFGNYFQVPVQLAFFLQSIRDMWKLRTRMHCRFRKMTACHLTVPLNGNVCCYGKFPYFISVEHTQQKTFWFF